MRTRSQSRNSNRQQQQVPPTFVEPFDLEEPIDNPAPPVVTMADNRTMAQLLEAPTEGYEDAIVVPEITADNFELKHGLLTLVQNKQFFGHDKEDPHASRSVIFNKNHFLRMKFPRLPNVAELKDMVKGLLLEKKNQTPSSPAHRKESRKVVLLVVVLILTEIVPPPMATFIVTIFKNLKGITTRSGVAYQGPTIPTTTFLFPLEKYVAENPRVIKDTVPPTNNGSTKDVQPPVVQVQPQVPNSEPVVAPVSAPMPNPKPTIPYPSRLNDQKIRKKANNQIEKFYQIFQDLHLK
ncbi:hypothetical protein Tco_1310252 [Tanacetum coccineum]